MTGMREENILTQENSIPYSKFNTLPWALYDAGNSAFLMGVVSLTIIHYGQILGMQQGLDYGTANFLVSAAVTLSTLLLAFTMPFFGVIC